MKKFTPLRNHHPQHVNRKINSHYQAKEKQVNHPVFPTSFLFDAPGSIGTKRVQTHLSEVGGGRPRPLQILSTPPRLIRLQHNFWSPEQSLPYRGHRPTAYGLCNQTFLILGDGTRPALCRYETGLHQQGLGTHEVVLPALCQAQAA